MRSRQIEGLSPDKIDDALDDERRRHEVEAVEG